MSQKPQEGVLTVREVERNFRRHRENDSNLSVTQQHDQSHPLPRVVSESLLDCRDIGTSPLAEPVPALAMEAAQLQEIHHESPLHTRLTEQEFKPIQQINVQLLGQDPKARGASLRNATGNAQNGETSTQSRPYRHTGALTTTLDSGLFVLKSENVDRRPRTRQAARNQKLEFRTPAHKSRVLKFSKQSRIFETTGRQQRLILKSPNPNDGKRVLVGTDVVIEADTLLNGAIYTHVNRRRPFSPQDHQHVMSHVQLFKQPQVCDTRTVFTLSGKQIDVNDGQMRSSFEQVRNQPKFRRTTESQRRMPAGAEMLLALQTQLKALSLEKLQAVYQYLMSNPKKQTEQQQLASGRRSPVTGLKARASPTKEPELSSGD